MGRILCAWSPSWAIANWRRRNPCAPPAEPPSPFALVETARGVRRLAAVDVGAVRLGLFTGQKAADAAALAPELTVADADPTADLQALQALTDWCVRYSPAVAADPPDGLYLDIEGVAHLWGGEAALMADFRRRLAQAGLPVRLAVADTPAAAWALARYGEDGVVAAPGDQARWLASLPPAALRLEPEVAAQVQRLGLKTLEQLFAIPRAPFARRFGAAALDRLDQALGRTKGALAFRRPPTPWFARLAFAEPISQPEDLARVCADICAALCARLEAAGQGARRYELAFHRLDGRAESLETGLSLAGRDPVRLAKLFAPRLETVDPGFGIEIVTLAAREVEALSPRQGRLDAGREAAVEEGLAPLVDRLANRLGEDRVWKAVPRQSHVPELAVSQGPPLAAPAGRGWDPQTPRPLRLFRRPQPIEAMALIPDDPPVQFSWRGRLHRIRHAEGPERVAEEWWTRPIDEADPGRVRDYYRLEDQDGRRFWVFRAGLYEAGQPAKWWMHGLFG
jgi:protein ImuB